MQRPPSTKTARELAELDGEIIGSVKDGLLSWKTGTMEKALATGIRPVVTGHGKIESRNGAYRTAIIAGERHTKRARIHTLWVYNIGDKAIVEIADNRSGPIGPPRVVDLAEAREIWRKLD